MPQRGTLGRGDERLRQDGHARRKVVETTVLLMQLQARVAEVSAARDAAVLELYAAGATCQEIASAAGLTRGRIAQILRRTRQP